MKNMGVGRLVLVRPRLRPGSRLATAMAVHAGDVLARARTVTTLAEAIDDCRLVVGTTRRGGLYRAAADSPDSVAPTILERARHGPVALVFGPEDHGLSNEDLKHCHRLVTISASAAYPSLNLAQAVLLCCYEVRRAALAQETAPEPRMLELAPAGEIDFALARLQLALLQIGFLHPQNPDHIMFAFRRLFGRAGLEKRDVRILLGLARQIEWYAKSGRQSGGGSRPSPPRLAGS